MRVCAPNPVVDNTTLCGEVDDILNVGPDRFIFACREGQLVTCVKCAEALEKLRAAFTPGRRRR